MDLVERKRIIEANRKLHPDWTDQQIIDFHLIEQAEEEWEKNEDVLHHINASHKQDSEDELDKHGIEGDKSNDPVDDEKLPF